MVYTNGNTESKEKENFRVCTMRFDWREWLIKRFHIQCNDAPDQTKSGCCRNLIKDDDMDCIGCSRCASWVHGSCAGQALMIFSGWGPIPTSNGTAPFLSQKLNTILSDFQTNSKILPDLFKNALPVTNENVKEAVTSSLPSYRDIVLNTKKTSS